MKDSLKADSAWIFTLSLDLLGGRAGSFCHCSVILFVVDSYWVDSSLNHLQLWGAAAGRAQALDMGVGSCWMPHGLVPVSARLVSRQWCPVPLAITNVSAQLSFVSQQVSMWLFLPLQPHLWPHWLLQAAYPPGFLSGVVKAPPNTQCEFIYFQMLPGTGELQCSSKDNMLILTIGL